MYPVSRAGIKCFVLSLSLFTPNGGVNLYFFAGEGSAWLARKVLQTCFQSTALASPGLITRHMKRSWSVLTEKGFFFFFFVIFYLYLFSKIRRKGGITEGKQTSSRLIGFRQWNINIALGPKLTLQTHNVIIVIRQYPICQYFSTDFADADIQDKHIWKPDLLKVYCLRPASSIWVLRMSWGSEEWSCCLVWRYGGGYFCISYHTAAGEQTVAGYQWCSSAVLFTRCRLSEVICLYYQAASMFVQIFQSTIIRK